jgi:hypothetical protein
MQIVNTFWEQNNLGVSSEEVVLENKDGIEDLLGYIKKKSKVQYTVIKVPQPKVEYFEILSSNGFVFRETLIEVKMDLNSFKLPVKLSKLDTLLSYQKASDIELENVCNEIGLGIFDTDRIALDNKFGVAISSKRYSNWVMDEYKKNNDIFQIYYKNDPIGFFGIKKKSDGNYDNFLAGIYLKYKSFGFGFSIISKAIEEIRLLGGLKYTTHISSNNLSVIRLYQEFGFVTQNLQYVFVRHK